MIPSQSETLTCIDGNIKMYDGIGKFTNGQWELNRIELWVKLVLTCLLTIAIILFVLNRL